MHPLLKTSLFILLIISSSAALQAQKTVYKAKYIINNPYFKIAPKITKPTPFSEYTVMFGNDNKIRVDNKGTFSYDILDFTKNETFTIYNHSNYMKPEFFPGTDNIATTLPAEEIGDTTILGYKCKIYNATCLVGYKEGRKDVTDTVRWKYYMTEELKYPADYKISSRNEYLPNVPLKGFLLRASKTLDGVATKQDRNPAPIEFYFYYKDLSFEPAKGKETDVPSNPK